MVGPTPETFTIRRAPAGDVGHEYLTELGFLASYTGRRGYLDSSCANVRDATAFDWCAEADMVTLGLDQYTFRSLLAQSSVVAWEP